MFLIKIQHGVSVIVFDNLVEAHRQCFACFHGTVTVVILPHTLEGHTFTFLYTNNRQVDLPGEAEQLSSQGFRFEAWHHMMWVSSLPPGAFLTSLK